MSFEDLVEVAAQMERDADMYGDTTVAEFAERVFAEVEQ